MEGIKADEEGALTSLGKLAARYARWQRDRSFTRFQRRPRRTPVFSIVEQKNLDDLCAKNRRETVRVSQNGASLQWREIRNSKSDAVDRTTSVKRRRSRGQPCRWLELEFQRCEWKFRACFLPFRFKFREIIDKARRQIRNSSKRDKTRIGWIFVAAVGITGSFER